MEQVPTRRDIAGPFRRRFWMAVMAIVALLVRLPGNDYGLPHHYAPDEPKKVERAMSPRQALKTYHLQPPLMLYGQVAFKTFAMPFHAVLRDSDIYRGRFPDEASYVLWTGRCLMAIMGALTVLAVFLMGERVASFGAGALAAAIYSVSPLAIACTHYLKEDNPLTLFTVLSLWQGSAYVEDGERRRPAWMGLFAALAFGSKFSGLALLPAGVAMIAQRRYIAGDRSGHVAPWAGFLVTFLGAGGVVFAPWVLNGFRQLSRGMADQSTYILKGHHDGLSISFLDHYGTFYLMKALLPAIGPVAVLLLFIGLVRMALRGKALKTCPLLVPALVSVGYWIAIECLPAKPYPFFARYLLPSVPALCVLSAWGAESISRLLSPKGRGRVVFLGLSVLAIATPLAESARAEWNLTPDTRDRIEASIRKHVPRGAWIVRGEYTGEIEMPDYCVVSYEQLGRCLAAASGDWVYLVVSSFHYQRFLDHPDRLLPIAVMYHALFDVADLIDEISADHSFFGYHNPELRIYRVNANAYYQRIKWYQRRKHTHHSKGPDDNQ